MIEVMLLDHWMEMRSVHQTSAALDELAKLMPEVAERLVGDDVADDARRWPPPLKATRSTLTRAWRAAARAKELALPQVDAFEALKGRGVRGHLQRGDAYVGGPGLLVRLDLTLPGAPLSAFTDTAGSKGQGVVYLVGDGVNDAPALVFPRLTRSRRIVQGSPALACWRTTTGRPTKMGWPPNGTTPIRRLR